MDMLKDRIIIWVVFLFCCSNYGQYEGYSDDTTMYSQIGKEGVFIHYNASLLFVGEYLYYSVYCLNKKTGKASDISKIAYVELIGENGTVIFRQKIGLENGTGQGDFFIPVSVPSGNYKLIGYTQWMMNWGEESFFQGDVSILNPYTNVQKPFLADQDASGATENTPSIHLEGGQKSKSVSSKNGGKVELALVGDTLSKREKVTMVMRSMDDESSFGRFSISVRRYDSLYHLERANSIGFKEELDQSSEELLSPKNVLPEIRGDLFSGTIGTDKPLLSLADQKVLFSMAGEEYDLKVLTTNEKGDFSFSLNNQYTSDTAVFQVLGHERENYTITLKEKLYPDYSHFTFKKFALQPEMEKVILERSIHNQVENAYFSAKPDTVKTAKKGIPFYGTNATVYHLDDYTRFPTFKETIVEIVSNIWVTRDKSGKPTLRMGAKNSSSYKIGYQPLVIVDGHVLQDFDKLIQYDARNIKTISITKDLYMIGGRIFQGILDVETFENDDQMVHAPYVQEVTLLKPLPNKNYFKQVYTSENRLGLKKIPDYRHQLLWLPKIELETMTETVELFTSDVPGTYEVSLEGFTFLGEPVSIKKLFRVN